MLVDTRAVTEGPQHHCNRPNYPACTCAVTLETLDAHILSLCIPAIALLCRERLMQVFVPYAAQPVLALLCLES